jgi:hypothetical protein
MPRTSKVLLRAVGAFCLCLVVPLSCSVNQTIVITSNGSGTMVMHAEVSRLLHDYIASLSEVSGTDTIMKGGKLFDAAAIRKDFESRPGITVKKVVTPTADSLDLEIAYTSLQNVFAQNDTLKSAGAIVYSESAGQKTVKLHLDRSNYTQLSSLFPLLKDPVLAGLGPQVNDTISDDDYLSMIKFTIGDDGPTLVKKSFITLTIAPEGAIVSQTGGTVTGGAVVFRIPLLRLLVLDKPLDFSVTFK